MAAWIVATGRGSQWTPLPNSVICSDHFDEYCFEPAALRRRLHSWAVPSLKLPFQQETQENPAKSAEPENSEEEPRTYNGPNNKQNEGVPPATTATPRDGPSDQANLERFKRRLIRTMARLFEQNESVSLWQQVEKAMGKSCRSLWHRMRMLTLKKISRLLRSGDVPARLSPVARMSVTDWLLVDLVLVHEEADLTSDTMTGPELLALSALLELVQEFDLETNGTVENWSRATVHYNQHGRQCSPMLLQRRWFDLKLLTRKRFYTYWNTHRRDPKALRPTKINIEIARRYPHVVTKVLPSWNEMRNTGRVILPSEFERIQRIHRMPKTIDEDADDVVLIEPNIETIDVDLVSELEEAASENVTDCNEGMAAIPTEISPKNLIEIELSDLDIKEEEIDVEFEEEETVPECLKIEDSDAAIVAENVEIEEESKNLLQIELGLYPESSTFPLDQATSANDGQNHVLTLPVILKVESVVDNGRIDVKKIPGCSMNIEPSENLESITSKSKNVNKDRDCIETEITGPPKEGTFDENTSLILEDLDSEPSRPGPKSMKKKLSTPRKNTKQSNNSFDMRSSLSTMCRPGPKCSKSSLYIEVDSGSFSKLLVRDSVSNLTVSTEAESHSAIVDSSKCSFTKEVSSESDAPIPSTSKQCFNQLTDSIPSTSKDDPVEFDEFNECDMDFTNNEIEEAVHIDEATLQSIQQEHINTVRTEEKGKSGDASPSAISVPSSPLNLEREEHHHDSESMDERISPKFDLKLLMLPVVYTKKLDDMEIFKNKIEIRCTVFNNVICLDEIEALSKPKSSKGVELNIHDELDHSKVENVSDVYAEECLNDNDNYAEVYNTSDTDDDIQNEPHVIKESSYLFQKPITRSYTPINLCKNPDFNTRLRRLSVAFLMKARNRQLIKACKPLTVDVQKAFEEKLVAGMLILNRSDKKQEENVATNNIVTNDIDCQSVTVAPSAMPAQSLFDKEKVDIHELTKIVNDSKQGEDVMLLKARQNKSIHLPDIEKVRLINRQLLTAQVPPLQVSDQISTEDHPKSNKRLLPKMPTQVYEVLRGPQGIEYKRQDERKIQEKPKIKEPKIKEPKRKVLSKHMDLPWYKRDYQNSSKENYLLKEDVLRKMISTLTPNSLPYKRPFHKLTYCCTAKRNKVLNDARCRLLINMKGELRRRRFQKVLNVHKCLPDNCKCCCKSLLPEPSPKPQLQEPESEIETLTIPNSVDPDSEIANALAGLEPIRAPSPIQNSQPAVGLAPIVKTPPKHEQVTPTKSSMNEVYKKSLSLSESCNRSTDVERIKKNEKTGASCLSEDVIELDDDSDQGDDITLRPKNIAEGILDTEISKEVDHQKEVKLNNSTDLDIMQEIVDKSIDLCEDGQNNPKRRPRIIRKKKDINGTKIHIKKDKIKINIIEGGPNIHSKGKKAQLCYWENVKEISKTAFGFDANKPKQPRSYEKVIMPQLVRIQNKCINTSPYNVTNVSSSAYVETQPSNIQNVCLDFPRGTKFTLLTNGQVFATSVDGLPLPLSESQHTALQSVINDIRRQSIVPMLKTVDTDDSSSTSGTLLKDRQVESYIPVPVVEINDSNSNLDLDQLSVNPAHVGVSLPSEKHPFSQDKSVNLTDLESTQDAKDMANTNMSIIQKNEDDFLKQASETESNKNEMTVASQSISIQDSNIEYQNEDSIEPIVIEATTEVTGKVQAIAEIAENPETNTNCTQDKSQTTTNKFLEVKNFAKMPLVSNATSKVSQNQNTSTSTRNSILSDLMEISGISSEDTNVQVLPNDIQEMPSIGVVQEWTNIGSDPNSFILTTNPSTQLSEINPKGQFYMYNEVTGQVMPISVLQKSPTKPKLLKLAMNSKSSQRNLGVVEIDDSESDKEVDPSSRSKQLLKLLKKKKEKNRSAVVKSYSKNLPLILKKQITLGKYEHATYSEYRCTKKRPATKKNKNAQVEAKIDLVDSDAPMEEEYLVDSQETDTESSFVQGERKKPSKRKRDKTTYATIALDSEDSSDDEPLSKIAAKKSHFENSKKDHVSPSTMGNTENEDIMDVLPPMNSVYIENVINSTVVDVFARETESNAKTHMSDELCENDLGKSDDAIDDTDSQDVDCILGM